jgi:hypothetical protein
MRSAGKAAGVPDVYDASIGATAPSSTAQCLAAKQAACHRQHVRCATFNAAMDKYYPGVRENQIDCYFVGHIQNGSPVLANNGQAECVNGSSSWCLCERLRGSA